MSKSKSVGTNLLVAAEKIIRIKLPIALFYILWALLVMHVINSAIPIVEQINFICM